MIARGRSAARLSVDSLPDRDSAPREVPAARRGVSRPSGASRLPGPTRARRSTTREVSLLAKDERALRRPALASFRWMVQGGRICEDSLASTPLNEAWSMYTPAEESGLSGQRLAARVQSAIDRIPSAEMIELMRAIRREAEERHLVYQRDGVDEIIRLLPCPITLRPDQLGYTHYVSQTLLNCMKRLPDLYFTVPEIQEILRVTPVEEEWLRECWTPAHREANPMFSRLDAVVDYSTAEWKDSIKFMEPNLTGMGGLHIARTSVEVRRGCWSPATREANPMFSSLDAVGDYSTAEWKDSIKFMEPNLTGIGGLHIAPTSMEVLANLVVPALLMQDSTIRLQLAEDIRDLLLQDLLEHLDAIGRPEGQIVLVDPKYSIDGPDEMQALVDYYKERYGITVLHADASELQLRAEEVFYGDTLVDLAYRDASVLDLMDLAAEGVDVAPMRALLRQNRVVSSIAAELDQKCFF